MSINTGKRRLLAISLVIFLSACFSSDSFYESFTIENAEMQELLIKQLQDAAIPIKIDEQRAVWFESENRAEVHDIAFKIMKRKDDSL